jgi:hypothetical protein
MIITLSTASQVSTCHHGVQLGWSLVGRQTGGIVRQKELLTTEYRSKGFISYKEELMVSYYLFIVDGLIHVCCETVDQQLSRPRN